MKNLHNFNISTQKNWSVCNVINHTVQNKNFINIVYSKIPTFPAANLPTGSRLVPSVNFVSFQSVSLKNKLTELTYSTNDSKPNTVMHIIIKLGSKIISNPKPALILIEIMKPCTLILSWLNTATNPTSKNALKPWRCILKKDPVS